MLNQSGFDKNKSAFGSLLGISYYLKKDDFKKFFEKLSGIWVDGSTILFDYPIYEEGKEDEVIRKLAKEANEPMQAKYSYEEIESILDDYGFRIYEHLNYEEITEQFFKKYNEINYKNCIVAPKGVNYCLAVKKR